MVLARDAADVRRRHAEAPASTPSTVDERLRRAATRLNVAKDARRRHKSLVDVSADLLGHLTRDAQAAHGAASRAQLLLDVQESSEFREIHACLQRAESSTDLLTDFQHKVCQTLRVLFDQLWLTSVPSLAANHLKRVYDWYTSHASALGWVADDSAVQTSTKVRPTVTTGAAKRDHPSMDAPGRADTDASVTLRPGSAFYGSERDGATCERLRKHRTKALVNSKSLQRLRQAAEDLRSSKGASAVAADSSWGSSLHHMSTASLTTTATAGSPSRAFASLRCASSPSCRALCTQAMSPATRTSGSSQCRGSAPQDADTSRVDDLFLMTRPVPSPSTPCLAAFEDARARSRSPTLEEVSMERRWLSMRNREIRAAIFVEGHRAAMRAWEQSRSRVEEEINRTIETRRLEAESAIREYVPPPDAEEDIEPTSQQSIAVDMQWIDSGTSTTAEQNQLEHPAADAHIVPRSAQESRQLPIQKGPGMHTAQRANRARLWQTTAPLSAGARFDVSQPGARAQPQAPERQPTANGRVARLRKLYAARLHSTEEADLRRTESAPSIVGAGEGARPRSLSPYSEAGCRPTAVRLEDDSDVVASLCPSWSGRRCPELCESGNAALDDLRFQQLQEVEAIKRVFARRDCPVNSTMLECALVMPEHKCKACAGVFDCGPNPLPSPLVKPQPDPKQRSRRTPSKRSRPASATRRGQAASRAAPPGSPRKRLQRPASAISRLC